MEFKTENGKVVFMMKAGNDMVKNSMLPSEAKALMESGKVVKKGGKIIVNDKFIFDDPDAVKTPVKTEKEPVKTEPVKEEPKKKPRRTRRAKK